MSHSVESPPSAGHGEDQLVDTQAKLEELLRPFEEEAAKTGVPARCAVDTEADSLHSYREKLCLIQFHCGGRNAIIDPLVIENLDPLADFLDRSEVWMHGADFDMTMLKRRFDRVPEQVMDTQIAVRLLGSRKFGLAAIIEENFGVKLSKASQKADWGIRPLTSKMVDYAINDVRYLLEMADGFVRRLEELGRLAWFHESCDAARTSVLERSEKDLDEVWRISGWGKLDAKGLAILRELWFWRDSEAERLDRPSFKIMNNEQLRNISSEVRQGRRPNLPRGWRSQIRDRFFESVNRALNLSEAEWPEKRRGKRFDKPTDLEERVKQLRAHRDKVAEGLGIDGTLIASKAVLERLVLSPEETETLLLRWQRGLMEEALSS